MKWKSAIAFLLGVVGLTALQFFARWAGYGNMPGPDPRGWGDPIPFDRALDQLPALLAISVIGGSLITLFYAAENGGAHDLTLYKAYRAGPHLSKTAPCPNCGVPIIERNSLESFECASCKESIRFVRRGGIGRTFAIIAGVILAVLSGQRGVGFLLIWLVSAAVLRAWLHLFRRPRLQLEPPIEFHRELR